jgi:hypothetical protein
MSHFDTYTLDNDGKVLYIRTTPSSEDLEENSNLVKVCKVYSDEEIILKDIITKFTLVDALMKNT